MADMAATERLSPRVILVIAVAALTTLWTIRVGHSGSEAVWQGTVQMTQ